MKEIYLEVKSNPGARVVIDSHLGYLPSTLYTYIHTHIYIHYIHTDTLHTYRYIYTIIHTLIDPRISPQHIIHTYTYSYAYTYTRIHTLTYARTYTYKIYIYI